MTTDPTLAARHLATLRAAAVHRKSVAETGISPAYDAKFHERLHAAVEWVAELISVLDICDCCGMPTRSRHGPCDCEPCANCNRWTDNQFAPDGRALCRDCREDLR